MSRAIPVLSIFLLAGLVSAPAQAQFGGGASAPVTLSGSATDLVDTTAGQDLWRFDFQVSGPMTTGDRLSIVFGSSFYSNLVALTPSVPGEFTVGIDTPAFGSPTFNITDDGATAAVNSFALGLVLSPAVVLPGSVSVPALYQGVGQVTAFMPLTTLNLVPAAAVPEAPAVAMMALGLLALSLRRRG